MSKKKIGAIILAVAMVGGLIFLKASTAKIKNGHVGVVYSIQE